MSDDNFNDIEDEDEIVEEIEIAKNMLNSLALITGATMIYVRNAEGKADEAAAKIVSAIGV